MADNIYRMGFPGRIWRFLLAPSEVAVAIHYHAPWAQADAAPISAAYPVSAPRHGGPCPV